jgi:hypothetical protein
VAKTKRKPARKKELKDHVLTVRIPLRVYEKVERIAEKEDRSVGNVVRRMIDRELSRKPTKKGKWK